MTAGQWWPAGAHIFAETLPPPIEPPPPEEPLMIVGVT